VIIKKICPLSKPADCKIRVIPDPNTPAKPVPDPKYPTTELGSPLQNPSVVLSPKALTVPKRTDDTRERKNEASY
jgi:hypothetical protein